MADEAHQLVWLEELDAADREEALEAASALAPGAEDAHDGEASAGLARPTTVITFTDFSAVWLLTQGGPYNTTHVFGTYAYNIGINAGDIGTLREFGGELGFAVDEVADLNGSDDSRRWSSTLARELIGHPLESNLLRAGGRNRPLTSQD